METSKYIWMDGQTIPWEKAQIHVLTHTLHYGAGVFEGIRFYETKNGPAVFRLKDHLKRLYYSAKCLEMKIPFKINELSDAILDLIKQNNLTSGYIRPIVYFGYGKMGLNPKGCPVNVTIAMWPWGSYLGEKPVRVKITRFSRIHPKSTYSDAKITGHYVNSILASLEIHKKGFDEAILMDHKGYVAEGPGENLFIVKKSKLFTPKKGNILPGITRDSVMKIAKKMRIKVTQKHISRKALLTADEAFFTGTAAEITPIASIDKKTIGNPQKSKIVTEKLKCEFMKAVKGESPEWEKWLTYVERKTK